MGSEDFSYMLEEKPGAYIWLGAGASSEKLHSPFYDFNDELLPIGAQYWADLAEKYSSRIKFIKEFSHLYNFELH